MHGPFPYHSSTSPSLATLPSMSGPKMMTNLLPQAQLGWTPWGYWPLLLSPWPLPQSMPTLEPSCCLPSIGDYCMVTHLTNHIPGPQHGWWHAIGRYPLPVHYSGGTGPGRVAKVTLRCVTMHYLPVSLKAVVIGVHLFWESCPTSPSLLYSSITAQPDSNGQYVTWCCTYAPWSKLIFSGWWCITCILSATCVLN